MTSYLQTTNMHRANKHSSQSQGQQGMDLFIDYSRYCSRRQTNNSVHVLDTAPCELLFKYSSHMAPCMNLLLCAQYPQEPYTTASKRRVPNYQKVSLSNQSYARTVMPFIYILNRLYSILKHQERMNRVDLSGWSVLLQVADDFSAPVNEDHGWTLPDFHRFRTGNTLMCVCVSQPLIIMFKIITFPETHSFG